MDHAVALVQTYLHLNGYFTATEYPVVEALGQGRWRSVTDVDLLAFRFPRASMHVDGQLDTANQLPQAEPDTILSVPNDRIDVVIGEVKEGRATMNLSSMEPAVLRAVLARFGCFDDPEPLIEKLREQGAALTSDGYQIRVVIFGGQPREMPPLPCQVISLGQVLKFLTDYVRSNWKVLRHVQFKDPAFGFLMTLEKARRGERRTRREPPDRFAGDGNRRRTSESKRKRMKYYKGEQFVPNKGVGAMFYEVDDSDTVTRFMSVFEQMGEIERMPDPPMKRLFRPELLEEVSAEEFERLWAE